MRIIPILAAGVTLAFATAANAQAPSTQPPTVQPPAAAPTSPTAPRSPSTPTIQSIEIVDVNELPEATQSQVNDVVAQRSEADYQKLRTSIDAVPRIKSELEAKGLTSAHVIAASIGPDGTLTLVTKKAS